MTDFMAEVEGLQHHKILPTQDYLSAERFISPYKNIKELRGGLVSLATWPIMTGLTACYYTSLALWSALRTVGNLLICKPMFALRALGDFNVEFSLSIALLIMTPIHALSSAIEILTKIMVCWISPEETTADLSNLGFTEEFLTEKTPLNHVLPSRAYLSKTKFFSSYKDACSFLEAAVSPIAVPIETGIHCLYETLVAVQDIIHCLANLLIAKPQHAYQCFRELNVHTSLALSLALMAPINMLVEGIALVSRLGVTWYSACTEENEEEAGLSCY